MSEKSGAKGRSIEKSKKLDVSSTKMGQGKALDDIQQTLDIQANELARKHNLHYSRKGAEMIRLINFCGLGDVGTDEMIGRYLYTKLAAAADPGKIEEWAKEGQAFRLQHNPQDQEGYFSAVVQNVASDDQLLLEEVKSLGLKYAPRYDCFDGTINVEAALAALRGTSATMRVKIGRSKGQPGYVAVLEKGVEVEGARAILFGDEVGQVTPPDEADLAEDKPKPVGGSSGLGLSRMPKPTAVAPPTDGNEAK